MINKQDKKVTVLPDGPVRSTSGRGIPRLHPVDDGLIDPDRHRAMIRRRDSFGAKLIDVVDPTTGFCRGVRSNAMDTPNNHGYIKPGVSGSHNSATRQVVVDQVAPGIYTDPRTGHVIRTCEMGDAPIPGVRRTSPSATTKTRKGAANVRHGAAKPATKPATPFDYRLPSGQVILVPGGQSGRFSADEIAGAIRSICEKRKAPVPAVITREMKMAARAMLKQRRAGILKSNGITEG